MEKTHDSRLILQQYIKKLHTASGQFSLYVNGRDSADTSRIKWEIGQIKELTLSIEREIEEIEMSNSMCGKNSNTSKNLDMDVGHIRNFE